MSQSIICIKKTGCQYVSTVQGNGSALSPGAGGAVGVRSVSVPHKELVFYVVNVRLFLIYNFSACLSYSLP